MAGFKDYYKILGVEKKASDKEIKQAYRKLARKYHPDVNPGDKSSEDRFKEVSEAYEVLSDKEKRAKYDQFGEQWQHAQRAGHAQVHEDRARLGVQQQVFRAPLDLVDALPAQQARQRRRHRPAQARRAHDQLVDAVAEQVRRDAAAGGFDFG